MAERLGRTVAELFYGSGGHRPLSAYEFTEWIELQKIRNWEHEQANRKAKR